MKNVPPAVLVVVDADAGKPRGFAFGDEIGGLLDRQADRHPDINFH